MRRKGMKRLTAVILTIMMVLQTGLYSVYASVPEIPAEAASAMVQAADGPEIQAPDAILIEASTGTVIYEKNADEARNPASVTKIMTLLLILMP